VPSRTTPTPSRQQQSGQHTDTHKTCCFLDPRPGRENMRISVCSWGMRCYTVEEDQIKTKQNAPEASPALSFTSRTIPLATGANTQPITFISFFVDASEQNAMPSSSISIHMPTLRIFHIPPPLSLGWLPNKHPFAGHSWLELLVPPTHGRCCACRSQRGANAPATPRPGQIAGARQRCRSHAQPLDVAGAGWPRGWAVGVA
jgi:hypothetical protein